MRFSIFTLLLYLLLHVMASTSLYACSCSRGARLVKQEVKRASWAVTGQVVAIEKITKEMTLDKGRPNLKTRFDYHKITLLVDTVFKGKKCKKRLVIHTGAGKGDCGFPFQLKESYVVYLVPNASPFVHSGDAPKGFKNSLWTDICTRTRVWEEQEVRVLEKLGGYKKRQK